ncbi:hypothetical protein B0H10DRAFT_1949297 [Mycena sp. CBHHK59/15]|nr:hypothetical protein B0H10DRAFT_1949297 [Mycena sp. CBHHK59/15]
MAASLTDDEICNLAGVFGASGVVGVSRALGASGAVGMSGAVGTPGAVGVSGVFGALGVVATSGVAGVAGMFGASGAVGALEGAGAFSASGALASWSSCDRDLGSNRSGWWIPQPKGSGTGFGAGAEVPGSSNGRFAPAAGLRARNMDPFLKSFHSIRGWVDLAKSTIEHLTGKQEIMDSTTKRLAPLFLSSQLRMHLVIGWWLFGSSTSHKQPKWPTNPDRLPAHLEGQKQVSTSPKKTRTPHTTVKTSSGTTTTTTTTTTSTSTSEVLRVVWIDSPTPSPPSSSKMASPPEASPTRASPTKSVALRVSLRILHPSELQRPTPGQHVQGFYTVTAGHLVGIFFTWAIVQGLISGIPSNRQSRFPSFDAALQAYTEAYNNCGLKIITGGQFEYYEEEDVGGLWLEKLVWIDMSIMTPLFGPILLGQES